MASSKRLFTQEHVERAKIAYGQAHRAQWELADVLAEAFPQISRVERGARGYPTLGYEVREFCGLAEMPLTLSEVARLRRLAWTYPPKMRKRASLSAHDTLRGAPEKLRDGMTVEDAELVVKGWSKNTRLPGSYSAEEGLRAALNFVRGSTARLSDTKDVERVGERIASLEAAVDELVSAFDGLALPTR